MRYLIGFLIALALLPPAAWAGRQLTDASVKWDQSVAGEIRGDVSVPFGKITLDAVATTTIAATDTWTEFAGSYTLNARASGVSMTATATGAKICNDTGSTWEFLAFLTVSVAAASNNQEYQVTLISDVKGPINCLNAYSESRFAGIYENVSGATHYQLDDGECLYAAIRNNTSTANFDAATVLINIAGIAK